MTLNLRLRGPNSSCSLLLPEGSTFGSLRKQIVDALTLEADRPFDILVGFPPGPLSHPEDAIVRDVVKNNESLRIQYSSHSGVQLQGHGKMKASRTKGQSRTQPQKKTSNPSDTVGLSPSFGAKVATLHDSSAAPVRGANSSSSGNSSSGNNASISASKSKRKVSKFVTPRRRASVADAVRSEEDLCDALIGAVAGGGSRRDRVLRSVFRGAVVHQYEETKAVDRVSAAAAGGYSIAESADHRVLNSGRSARMEVTFSKGAGSRSNHLDNVDLLSKQLLLEAFKVALLEPESKEALKPINLARCSPRLFWSLVRHYGNDAAAGIRAVLEGIDDCEWLGDRKRQLSEKAEQNARQLEQKAAAVSARKAAKSAATTATTTSAAAASGEGKTNIVDSAVLNSSGISDETIQSIRLKVAFQCRIEDVVPAECVAVVQESLSKYNQDKELTVSSSSSSNSSSHSTNISSNDNNNSSNIGFKDNLVWQLAGLDSFSRFLSVLHSSGGDDNICLEDVADWVDTAQSAILLVMWHFVCGGGSARLRNALGKLRIRSPREMKVWQYAADGLRTGLLQLDAELEHGVKYRWSKFEYTINSGQRDYHSNTGSGSSNSNSFTGSSNNSSDGSSRSCDERDSNSSFNGLSEANVAWMISLCDQLLKDYKWLQEVNPLLDNTSATIGAAADIDIGAEVDDGDETDDVSQVAKKPRLSPSCLEDDSINQTEERQSSVALATTVTDTTTASSSNSSSEEGWMTSSDAHPLIGQRARIWIDDSELFWEDGSVVAYLPPDQEEPMALWRVKLDEQVTVGGVCSDADSRFKGSRIEDLEEHEIVAAIERFK